MQLPNTCEDGGFDCIQLSVAKSKVWKLAMPDQRQEWLNDAIKVEEDVIISNNFLPP